MLRRVKCWSSSTTTCTSGAGPEFKELEARSRSPGGLCRLLWPLSTSTTLEKRPTIATYNKQQLNKNLETDNDRNAICNTAIPKEKDHPHVVGPSN
jgi:hypothetical protein